MLTYADLTHSLLSLHVSPSTSLYLPLKQTNRYMSKPINLHDIRDLLLELVDDHFPTWGGGVTPWGGGATWPFICTRHAYTPHTTQTPCDFPLRGAMKASSSLVKAFIQLIKRDSERLFLLPLKCQKYVERKKRRNGKKMPLLHVLVYQKCFCRLQKRSWIYQRLPETPLDWSWHPFQLQGGCVGVSEWQDLSWDWERNTIPSKEMGPPTQDWPVNREAFSR
jgi:hypothetical protein